MVPIYAVNAVRKSYKFKYITKIMQIFTQLFNKCCLINKFLTVQWLGLVYPEGSIYVDSLRECYEAYVIYNFMMYLLAYLNADHQLEHRLEISPQVHHMFPLCCLPDWEMGREFVHMCKHGILQYTAVRPISTLISL